MATTPPTIAGVETGAWSIHNPDNRQQNKSIGQSASGTVKHIKFRASDRMLTITLSKKSTTIKNSLITALEADADGNVELHPADHVDCGGGAGVAVNAQWMDKAFNAVPVKFDAWDIVLNFLVIP